MSKMTTIERPDGSTFQIPISTRCGCDVSYEYEDMHIRRDVEENHGRYAARHEDHREAQISRKYDQA